MTDQRWLDLYDDAVARLALASENAEGRLSVREPYAAWAKDIVRELNKARLSVDSMRLRRFSKDHE